MSRTPSSHRWLILAAGLALLLRAVVPTGWMPTAAAGGGLGLAPCQSWSSEPTPAPSLHGHHASRQQRHDGNHGNKPDQPCAFAGLSLSWTGDVPGFDLPAAPHAAVAEPSMLPEPAAPPRLAAPPPPPTGPPAFA